MWGSVPVCLLGVAALAVSCSGDGGPAVPTLSWYVNPDNGGQARLAARCAAESGGRWRLRVLELPRDATQQREQLVRRLAARDASIDLMSLDLPFVAELAAAGFLRPFGEGEAAPLAAGVLPAPLAAATWSGRLVAAAPVTWDTIVAAAERTGTTVEVQAGRYEGYLVWIAALVASAGGAILERPEAGKGARPALASPAGARAAAVIRRLARSTAADPALSTSEEESARAAFQGAGGGFMVNWTYVRRAAADAVDAGALDRAVLDDIGWARYPRVDPERASRPPLGGIALAVGAFARRGELAVEAIRCLTSLQHQVEYMAETLNPAAREAAYDAPEVRRVFPMADLVRVSLRDAAPRPLTPYYADVSAAVVREFHPPADVDPERTPAAAARLVEDVLADRVLL